MESLAAGSNIVQRAISVEHITITSKKPFGEVEAALERSVPRLDPAMIEALAKGNASARELFRSSELFIFEKRDHGALLRGAGQKANALQYEIGNPMTAASMTRYQLPAALYAPLRVVLYENATGGASFEYDLPSSLFGQFGDDRVKLVALKLDDEIRRALSKAAE
ncbi:MAG TPA: DUF302 domain-containing protein [Methylovirgula sp.]|nr:DUF302 domain-containing protein [Methylovirgula sp.]